MSYAMSDLLHLMVSEGGSDLHVRVGVPPAMRLHGILQKVDGPALTNETSEELMRSITSDDSIQEVRESLLRCIRKCDRVSVTRALDAANVDSHTSGDGGNSSNGNNNESSIRKRPVGGSDNTGLCIVCVCVYAGANANGWADGWTAE